MDVGSAAFLAAASALAISAASADTLRGSGMCRLDGERMALKEVPEASGVVVSRRTPGRLWVHNDSKDPILFAVDPNGAVTPVNVRGASIKDWEDLQLARCGERWCLYIADIG